MNAIRFKHFWFYLLDLHNLKVNYLSKYYKFQKHNVYFKVEGKLRTLANPLVPTRLQDVLQRMSINIKKQEEEDSEIKDGEVLYDDEVSCIYYGK